MVNTQRYKDRMRKPNRYELGSAIFVLLLALGYGIQGEYIDNPVPMQEEPVDNTTNPVEDNTTANKTATNTTESSTGNNTTSSNTTERDTNQSSNGTA